MPRSTGSASFHGPREREHARRHARWAFAVHAPVDVEDLDKRGSYVRRLGYPVEQFGRTEKSGFIRTLSHAARDKVKESSGTLLRIVSKIATGTGQGGNSCPELTHLDPCPRDDRYPVVQRETKAVDEVVEENDGIHRPAQPPEILDAQPPVPHAGLAVQALREEDALRIQEIQNSVRVGLAGCGPYHELHEKGAGE